jgi:uncharacterized protein YjiS (DUF1127 family)
MSFESRSAARAIAPGALRAAPARTAWPWSMLAALSAHLRRTREIRRARAELESLDDRALRDIGLTRQEIDLAVRGELRPWGHWR